MEYGRGETQCWEVWVEPGNDEPWGVWGRDAQGEDPVGGLVGVEPVRGIGEEEAYPPGPFQFFPWADPGLSTSKRPPRP